MNILVFGHQTIGCTCVQVLLDVPHTVVGIVTEPEDPAAAGWFDSLESLAKARHLPLFTPEKVNSQEFLATVHSLQPDLILSCDYPQHLEPPLLTLAPRGAFNLYATLLPRYRGHTPHIWAVMHGETTTGVTLHDMSPGSDGDIIAQQTVPILWTDHSYDVYRKQAEAAAALLRRVLPELLESRAPRTPIGTDPTAPFGRLQIAACAIDWNRSGLELYHLIRAVSHPYPGASAGFRGRRCTIWSAEVRPAPLTGHVPAPGSLIKLVPFYLATGNGLVIPRQLQLEGEPELDAGAFIDRYHVTVGERFTAWPD